ncbi:MAG: hypothetical protein EOO17_02805 [Chloroflexi bacterium]|nr:MAG: hypothetical protein EOO17_02805 [Chloroflexota bacterium]
MPAIYDELGRVAYVEEDMFFPEHPSDFLNPQTYTERLLEARRRVLEIIRFLDQNHSDRGLNHQVRCADGTLNTFTNFIDKHDGRKSKRVRKQGHSKRVRSFGGFRVKSPQNLRNRRRSLFSLDDVPVLFFDEYARNSRVYEHFIDLMRWHLLREAIRQMIDEHEIELLNGIWHVKVTVLDIHRGCGKRSKKASIKRDDRSYHGRPNRDRGRTAA